MKANKIYIPPCNEHCFKNDIFNPVASGQRSDKTVSLRDWGRGQDGVGQRDQEVLHQQPRPLHHHGGRHSPLCLPQRRDEQFCLCLQASFDDYYHRYYICNIVVNTLLVPLVLPFDPFNGTKTNGLNGTNGTNGFRFNLPRLNYMVCTEAGHHLLEPPDLTAFWEGHTDADMGGPLLHSVHT